MDADEHQEQEDSPDVPKGQKFMDNLLWLFLASLLISFVIYNAWGIIELRNVPPLIP